MSDGGLHDLYLNYLDCLNRQDWAHLGSFVAAKVIHNDRTFGLSGYREMLEGDFQAIPDLRFTPELITVATPHVACRLAFDCTPVGQLFGLPVNGRRVRFHENVFYRFENARISQVWSIIDLANISSQLAIPV